VHKVDLTKGEQKKPEFLKMNPLGAIPVLVDHDGPNGKPLTICQSGAIVIYACEKAGKFIPTNRARRAMAGQWFVAAASDIRRHEQLGIFLGDPGAREIARQCGFLQDPAGQLFSQRRRAPCEP
jgi:glutathione S-transferase